MNQCQLILSHVILKVSVPSPELSLLDYSKELDNDGEQSEKKILLKKPALSLDERQVIITTLVFSVV